MTERPKGSGTWRLRVYVGRDPDTDTPIQESRTFRGTETAARKELAKLVAAVEGRVVVPNRATVGQLLDRWVAHVEAIGKARPKTVYEPPWDAWRLPTLETRMESWHQRRDRSTPPHVATRERRRLRPSGSSGSFALSSAPSTGRSGASPASSATARSRYVPG